jgi:hypothetical protein
MSNVLDLVDQTIFRVERAAGVTNLIQCVWAYNRPVDINGLCRFHDQLRQGRLSRRIERSPLPFGRHRWVSPSDQPELEIIATPRCAKNSTPGLTSRPTLHWMPSTDPDGTSRCSPSPTAASG